MSESLFKVAGTVTYTALFLSFHPVYVQSSTSNPPSPRPHRRGSTSRPVRRHTSRSESHASHGRYGRATPESSLDVTQSLGLTAAGLGHRRTSAAQEAQMKKTKSLDHQLSSEAKDYDSIEQVDYIIYYVLLILLFRRFLCANQIAVQYLLQL